jgi:hypothetical protein
VCTGGQCTPLTGNPACGGESPGTCRDDGVCVQCINDDACAPCGSCNADNECAPLDRGVQGGCPIADLPQDQQVCDGAGACFDPACLTDGDCAACQTCVELTCSGRVEAREPCGDPGQFCDGEGSCVGCIDSDDCTPCNSCVDSVCTVTSEEGDACGDGGFCNA